MNEVILMLKENIILSLGTVEVVAIIDICMYYSLLYKAVLAVFLY